MDFYRILGFLKIKINFLEIFRLSKDIKIFDLWTQYTGNGYLPCNGYIPCQPEYLSPHELEERIKESMIGYCFNILMI